MEFFLGDYFFWRALYNKSKTIYMAPLDILR